ncbi:endo-1,4-beta-glucanase [Ophidiomyces ophidiicola]|nr:endo-1,4-beta-glucanase [Ophidiomyces ophidiicola]
MAFRRLYIDGTTFRDSKNREVILRGINVDATAKFPKTPNIPSYVSKGFFDGDNVSFVGRPFSLEDAPTHFERLKKWGYNQIRYIFTWEAIEHRGPRIYDEEWIDFTIHMLRVLNRYGFYVYMDPHQDVWSRFSGGSGAPMWTLCAAGLDPLNFSATEAALVQNTYPDPASFTKMIWSTNYTRLACQTMFTLFWAGKDFAPKAIIDGLNIQDFLQDHYISAVKHLAQRIKEAEDLENEVVIGWESMNEPNRGLVGYQDISVIPQEQQLQLGTSPTAFQAMLTGSGRACEIATWAFGGFGPHKTGRQLVDPKGVSAWLSTHYEDTKYGWERDPQWKLGECLWAQHGVWDPKSNTLLKKDYFAKDPKTGVPLDYEGFTNQYFMDHFRKYRDAIRSVHPNAILFCQPPVMEMPPNLKGTADDDPNMVHAVHFYDGLTLMTKHWNRVYNVDVVGILRGKYLTPAFGIKLGETAIRNCLRDQLRFLRKESLELMGTHPAILTEIGIPYDMDDKYAYKTGNYSSQVSAMDANHYAIEGSGMNGFSLWTYMSTNIHEWGDHWNGEDLSIYSLDDLPLPTGKTLSDVSKQQSSASLDPASPAFSLSRADSVGTEIKPDNLKRAIFTPSISTRAIPNLESSDRLGYRAAEAYIRPSPVAIHGDLTQYGFDLRTCLFTMDVTSMTATPRHSPTIIYLPEFHYPSMHINVTLSSGQWDIDKEETGSGFVQYLRWWHAEGEQKIEIQGAKRKPGENLEFLEDEEYLKQCRRAACVLM